MEDQEEVLVTQENLASPEDALLTIGAVASATGISSHVLRAWETRYGFPVPVRSAAGQRRYREADIGRIHLLRTLSMMGYRLADLVDSSEERLKELIDKTSAIPPRMGRASDSSSALQNFPGIVLKLVRAQSADQLKRFFFVEIFRSGLSTFVCDCLIPTARLIGEEWANGHLNTAQERLFSTVAESVIIKVADQLKIHTHEPQVLMASVEGEHHTLLLRYSEALLNLEGLSARFIGGNIPVQDLANTVSHSAAQTLLLGFSQAFAAENALQICQTARSKLNKNQTLWVGAPQATALLLKDHGIVAFWSVQQMLEAVRTGQQNADPRVLKLDLGN